MAAHSGSVVLGVLMLILIKQGAIISFWGISSLRRIL